jgi:hypothetical protein
MNQVDENKIAIWIKDGRLQDVSKMNFKAARQGPMTSAIPPPIVTQPAAEDVVNPQVASAAGTPVSNRLNKSRKIVLSAGIGLFLILGALAFISQSPRFPETTFEGFCFWSAITAGYTAILFRLWR